MRRIALFGGGFNPPHLAHLFTVTYLQTRVDVDEVWVMPAHRHAFSKEMLSFEKRVCFLEKLFNHLDNVKICDIESENHISGRTYDTLIELANRYPTHLFSMVIGSDNLRVSEQWYRFDEIISNWGVIVMGRPGFEDDLDQVKSQLGYSIGPTLPAVSSSQIRQRLSLGDDTLNWLEAPLCWVPDLIKDEVVTSYARQINLDQQPREIDLKNNQLSICIWGQGKCGGSLAKNCKTLDYTVYTIQLRDLWQLDLGKLDAQKSFNTLLQHALDFDIWLLASKDDEIERLAQMLALGLANQEVLPKVICHCSGSRSPNELNALSQLGCLIGQFHPLFSFKSPQTPARLQRGITYAISGDVEAVTILSKLATDLGGFSLLLQSKNDLTLDQIRVLYHAAAVFGASLSLAPIALCERLFEIIGIRVGQYSGSLQPLYQSALSPYLETNQHITSTLEAESSLIKLSRSLTGPIARQDLETIENHLEVLELLDQNDPDRHSFVDAYVSLSLVLSKLLDATECDSLLEQKKMKNKLR